MENNFNGQNNYGNGYGNAPDGNGSFNTPVQGGYRPYVPYTPQYPAGANGGDMFAVSPQERKSLKKQYFGTFGRAMVHCIGSFVLAQAIFLIMSFGGYEFRYTDDGTAIVDWLYNIAGSIPSIIFCIGIFLFDKCTGHVPARDYFRTDRISSASVLSFFGMVMFAYGAALICQALLINGMFSIGISPISEDYLTEEELSPLYLAVSFVTTAILAPIAEELMFRGVILRRLSKISQSFAIFMSALIFGLMHGNFVQTVLGIFLGIVFGYAAVKTGSLILPIAGHIFVNTAAMTNSFAEYYIGEDAASTYWMILIGGFMVIGTITFIVLLSKHMISFPQYNEYHKKRTFPIIVTCVSFWLMMCIYLFDCISTCGPVTEKLMGE